MDPRTAPDLDAGYRQLREECGLLESEAFAVSLEGGDAAEFLQGQVTNDVEAIAPGGGCYALLLDRKGHIKAEMRVLRTGEDRFLLLTTPNSGPTLEKHLRTYSVGHQVAVSGRTLPSLYLIGPACHDLTGTAPLGEHGHRWITVAGEELMAVDTDLGLELLAAGPEDSGRGFEPVLRELQSSGAELVSPDAIEILRVERGRPRFGREMDESNMPAEAGIVDRAISFEKGCYIGQEPVARLHYKGRPNRHLRGLRLSRPIDSGGPVRSGERELGRVGSAVVSPALGPIGLAILRREAEPGDQVLIGEGPDSTEATVVELPFPELATGGQA